jgi:hypothetical protein
MNHLSGQPPVVALLLAYPNGEWLSPKIVKAPFAYELSALIGLLSPQMIAATSGDNVMSRLQLRRVMP